MIDDRIIESKASSEAVKEVSEGLVRLGSIIHESCVINKCSNPQCRCNQPKEKKLKKCWFRHNFHLDFHKTDCYICTRCGEIEGYSKYA